MIGDSHLNYADATGKSKVLTVRSQLTQRQYEEAPIQIFDSSRGRYNQALLYCWDHLWHRLQQFLLFQEVCERSGDLQRCRMGIQVCRRVPNITEAGFAPSEEVSLSQVNDDNCCWRAEGQSS